MMKYFYSHLIEIESLFVELEKLDLSDKEKQELSELVDANLHHTILDAILSQLSDEEKHTFMKHLSDEKHDEIWDFLNKRSENIEEKIKLAAESVKNELHEDLKQAQKMINKNQP